jgi:hypothetical protein
MLMVRVGLRGDLLTSTSGTSISNTVQFASGNVTGQIRGQFVLQNPAGTSVNTNDAYIWRIAAVGGVGNAGSYNSNLSFLRTTRAGVTDESVLSLNGYTGNVGIGTTAPATKLEVSSSLTSGIKVTNSGTINGEAGIEAYHTGAQAGTAYAGYITKTGAGGTNVGIYTAASGATNNYGLIVGSGNVGIGTTSPGIGDGTYVAPLTISSASTLGTFLAIKNTQATYGMGGVWMQANTGNAGWLFGTDNDGKGVLHYGSGASENDALTDAKDGTKGITIDTSGNVGIGTTSPGQKLQGNVGIGTTSPSALLHVSQASANTVFRLGNNTTYDQFIYFNGNNDWSLGMDYSNSNAFVLSNASSIGTNDRIVVTTAGNVKQSI